LDKSRGATRSTQNRMLTAFRLSIVSNLIPTKQKQLGRRPHLLRRLAICRSPMGRLSADPYHGGSEAEAYVDRRVDVDVAAGLIAIGEAIVDFRPNHAGIEVEFFGKTPIDQRRNGVQRARAAFAR
jgi:hypothetical protein